MTHEISNEDLTGKGLQSSLTTYEIPAQGFVEEKSVRSAPKARSLKRIGLTLLGLMLLATLGLLIFRTFTKPKTEKLKQRGAQVVPVTVATVTQKTVPVQLQAIGHVQAESTVSVTPQASGQITRIYFKKGQEVKKGQLLFTLDDRTQNAAIQQAQGTLAKDIAQVQQARATLNKDLTQVRQAQANLAKDMAQEKFAKSEATRYGNLYKQGAVTQDQAEQYSTSDLTATATLQADRAAIANAQAAVKVDEAAIQNAQGVVNSDQGTLKNAQVQLSYTKIYAPIDGRAGDILVDQGNVVQTNSTNPLLTIDQIRPIQVAFSVPEAALPQIQKYTKDNKLTVDITFPNSNAQPIRGVLTFVNNTVDNTTGTIQLIGNFDNIQGQLWPGQYVNTTLTLTSEPNAIVVPAQAVQDGPNGQFVFVVKPDDTGKGGTVENIPVAVSSTVGGLDVVTKGLQPNQIVVTDGQANLISGNKVRIKTASDSAGSNAPNSGKRHSSNSAAGGT